MTIKYGSQRFVLCGPPIRFTAKTSPQRPDGAAGDGPLQLSLF
jgi:hypothetical protein